MSTGLAFAVAAAVNNPAPPLFVAVVISTSLSDVGAHDGVPSTVPDVPNVDCESADVPVSQIPYD